MGDRSVRVILRAEIADFKAKLSQAEAQVKQFAQNASAYVGKNAATIDGLSGTVGKVGLALTAVGALAVKRFADFDAAMSGVAATGEDARASIDGLRQAALDAGRETSFTATEAAGAITELTKAGLSATDVLSGGLDGALSLAAAGQLDVADAAGIASVALKQFGLNGADVSHVADLLAAGAGKAMGDVSDLGAALRQSGQVAAQTGLSIEETTAGLAAFASAGLLGSDAGTSLKTMLQRLAAPAGDASARMSELGISAYDASGNFVGLQSLAGQLQTSLGDLTPQARDAALAIIFGADSARAASVLYNEGADGIARWTREVDDAGYAADVARTQLDNLKGDLEALGGSVETALIGMGESADGPLRAVVQGATDAVNALSDLPPAAQGVTMALVGGGGLVALGVAGVGKLAVAFNEAKTAMAALGWTARSVSLATGAVGAALGLAALAFQAWSSSAADARQRVDDYTQALQGQTDAITTNVRAVAAKRLADDGVLESARRLGVSSELIVDAITGEAGAYEEVTAQLEAFHGTAQMGAAEREQMRSDVNDVSAALGRESEALADARTQQELTAEAVGETEAAHEGATEAIDEQTASIEALIDALDALNGANNSREQAEINWQDQLGKTAEALATNGKTLDITTEAGRANRQSMLDMAESAQELASKRLEQTGSEELFRQTLLQGRDALVEQGIRFGLTREDAEKYADQLLQVPADVKTEIQTPGLPEAKQNIADLIAAINGVPAHKVITFEGRSLGIAPIIGYVPGSGQPIYGSAKSGMYRGGVVGLGMAAGGLVPGVPPSDPRVDNVLAAGPGGLIALRSGEFVSTEGSTRRNLRALQAGNEGAVLVVAGYSGGGEVHAERVPQGAGGAGVVGVSGGGVVRLHPDDVRALVQGLALAGVDVARAVGDRQFDELAWSIENTSKTRRRGRR